MFVFRDRIRSVSDEILDFADETMILGFTKSFNVSVASNLYVWTEVKADEIWNWIPTFWSNHCWKLDGQKFQLNLRADLEKVF